MKWIAGLLVLSALLFFAYPYANEQMQNRKEQKLLDDFTTNFNKTATQQQVSPDNFKKVDSVLANGVVETTVTPRVLDDKSKALLSGNAIALISIKKIDLLLPILEGATQENMKHAATHITETTAFGEVGNAGISAHRARTKGRLFNRLDEIQVGDKIVIKTADKDFTYTVFKTRKVLPVQVSVLNRNNVDKILTLITCDPIPEATHRLIIQAKLDE
jgi:sortase A